MLPYSTLPKQGLTRTLTRVRVKITFITGNSIPKNKAKINYSH